MQNKPRPRVNEIEKVITKKVKVPKGYAYWSMTYSKGVYTLCFVK